MAIILNRHFFSSFLFFVSIRGSDEAKIELRLLEVKRFVETIQYSNQKQNIDSKELEYKEKKDGEKVLFEYKLI